MTSARYFFPFIIALALSAGAVFGEESDEYEIVDIELMEEADEEPAEEPDEEETLVAPEAEATSGEASGDVETEQSDADTEAMNAGFAALQNKDYSSAYNIFQSLAQQDNTAAQYELGVLYHRGLGVDRDVVRASQWYTRAAEQGNMEAQYRLGNMYLMGEGVRQSDSEATYWLEKAAQQGHTDAKHNLTSIQRISQAKTGEELEQEAADDPPDDRAETADVTEKNVGRKTKKKRGFFKRLLGRGDRSASANNNDRLLESDDPEDEMPTPTAPIGVIEPKSSSGGEENGPASVVTDDEDDAPPVLTASLPAQPEKKKKGFFSRLFNRDKQKNKTSSESTSSVQPDMAGMELKNTSRELAGPGNETTQSGDHKAPLNPLERSGAVSNYELGMAYVLGDTIAQDHTKAFEHFATSAEQGYAPAQFRLGVAYAHGEGTRKDLSKAVEWYEKSALQGHTIAQRSLGVIYLNGQEGMDPNKPLALAWYSLLAEDGNLMDTHRRDTLLRELSDGEIQTSEELKNELQNRLAREEEKH